MSGDKKGFSIRSLIFRETDDEKPEDIEPANAAPTTPGASVAPILLSTMTAVAGAPVAAKNVNSGPSARTLEMVAAAIKQIPANNAQFKLDAAMESIKAIEPDANKRRAMALAILGSQGISAEVVETDSKLARGIMSDTIGTLSAQLKEKRADSVDKVRSNASQLREQAAGLEADITKIRERQTQLVTDAGELEGRAAAEENTLNGIAADIEAALAIVNQGAK